MELSLQSGKNMFMEVTSAGVFHLVCTPEMNDIKKVLFNILSYGFREELSIEIIMRVTGAGSVEDALGIIYKLQRIGYIKGSTSVAVQNFGDADNMLTVMLGRLSSIGKAVLADGDGMYVASSGLTHESAEELAGFSVECINLYQKHIRLMVNNLRIGSSAFALVNPSGRSEIGVWPVYIEHLRFALIIEGLPRLQHEDFVNMIRLLYSRYSEDGNTIHTPT